MPKPKDRESGLNRLGAAEAGRAIAAGEITSETLVADCLARIEAREDDVAAWEFLDPDLALAQARACDQGAALGPLHGVPIAIKDVFDTKDMPTGYGSPIYKGHHPEADSAVIAAKRAAGMVILGKTVTAEFASAAPPRTRNPMDLARVPGVSSSGSAAAVADFMAPLATGTQTGGSVIRPASYCGVHGYKASLEGLDRTGLRRLKEPLDTIGLFARSLDDIAVLREAITGTAPAADDFGSARPPRIGLCRTPHWHEADPAAQDAIETAAGQLGAAGAPVEDVELRQAFRDLPFMWDVIGSVEWAYSLEDEYRAHAEQIGPQLRERIAAGFETTPERYAEAENWAAQCRQSLDEVFTTHDVLLTPAAEGEAPLAGSPGIRPWFNASWTLMHVPCISLPALSGPNGMPIGLQLIGRRDTDDQLIAAARWIESRIG